MNWVISLDDNISFNEIIEEWNYLTTSNNHINNSLLWENNIFIFKKMLRDNPRTIGVPYNYNSLLWIFLENKNLEIIKKYKMTNEGFKNIKILCCEP